MILKRNNKIKQYMMNNVVVFEKIFKDELDENEEDINYKIKISKLNQTRNKYQVEIFDSNERYFHQTIQFTKNDEMITHFQIEDVVFEKHFNFETRQYDIWVTLHYTYHGEYNLCILLEDQTLFIMNQQIKKLEYMKKIKYDFF